MASKPPSPDRQHHQTFCESEGWQPVSNARGQPVTHHATYELHLGDGTILRTRISHPVDRTEYSKRMWSHILRDQLAVTSVEFWTCVLEGQKPDRGDTQPERKTTGLPSDLLFNLISKGVPAEEAAKLTKEEALARLQHIWASAPTTSDHLARANVPDQRFR